MDQTLKLRINYSQFEFSKWVVYLLTRKHFTILTLKILQKFQRLYFIYFSLKETPLWGKLRNFTPSRQWTCKKKKTRWWLWSTINCFKISIREESECIKVMFVIDTPMTPIFIYLLCIWVSYFNPRIWHNSYLSIKMGLLKS